jgi:hypothetical protein
MRYEVQVKTGDSGFLKTARFAAIGDAKMFCIAAAKAAAGVGYEVVYIILERGKITYRFYND